MTIAQFVINEPVWASMPLVLIIIFLEIMYVGVSRD